MQIQEKAIKYVGIFDLKLPSFYNMFPGFNQVDNKRNIGQKTSFPMATWITVSTVRPLYVVQYIYL